MLVVVLVSLLVQGRLGLGFDIAFVVVCVGAALWVHPRDFFVVGVLPPLLLASVVVVLAVVDRSSVARPQDGVIQAIVSGLAHRAVALTAGYALTLVVLALRQVALRHQGTLRPRQRTRPARVDAVLEADPAVAPLDTEPSGTTTEAAVGGRVPRQGGDPTTSSPTVGPTTSPAPVEHSRGPR